MPHATERLRRDWKRPEVLALLVLYAAIVLWCALHHELWRDEVRAASIAHSSRWPWDLIRNLHNEGHPPLWYWLLYVGTFVGRGLWVLKPIAAAVGIASA